MTETNGHISLDEKTQGTLRSLITASNELQMRMKLVLDTYVSASGKTGDYRLNKECTQLELVEENVD